MPLMTLLLFALIAKKQRFMSPWYLKDHLLYFAIVLLKLSDFGLNYTASI
jgi:hypothetical protein